MTFERIKKGIVALTLTAAFTLAAGVSNTSVATAQYRNHRWGWQTRNGEQQEMWRVRRLDRERQLRYRMNGPTRMVGYYDRFGRFHAYGYYDRFGRLHRY